jgi:hypothetical protein
VSGGIDPAAAEQLLCRWWSAYDEGSFEVLAQLLDDDAHFACRTDTGTTDFEEFVRADATGRDLIVRWQTQHRLDSPYPLRHHCTNFHLTDRSGDDHRFRHYLSVAAVKHLQPDFVPGGVVDGAVRLRDGRLRIADLVVTLDTMDSVPLRDLRG